MQLSAGEIDHFNEHGYVGPFSLLETDVADTLRERIFDEILTRRSATYEHTEGNPERVSRTRDRHLDSPLMYRIASLPGIVGRVSSLLGPDVLLWRSDIFAQGSADPVTPPHQDVDISGTLVIPCIEATSAAATLFVLERPTGNVALPLCVTAWMTFSQVRAETGALWVVPGTHRAVVPEVPGEGIGGRPTKLARTFTPADGRVLEMRAGEFILFHNLLVHGSMPVREGRRLAWNTRHVAPQTRIYPRGSINAQGQDLSRFGSLIVSGSPHVHSNVLRAPPSVGIGSLVDELAIAE